MKSSLTNPFSIWALFQEDPLKSALWTNIGIHVLFFTQQIYPDNSVNLLLGAVLSKKKALKQQ